MVMASSGLTLFKLQAVFFLSIWMSTFEHFPKPAVKSTTCDSTNSSIVRKFVEKNWNKLLQRHGVSLPFDCPLHNSRDMFGGREQIKQARSSHWECRKCGKKFYHEHYLDLHLERKHSEIANLREDSVCLGDYCDVMRCSVILTNTILADESRSTDISLWIPNTTAGPHSSHPPHAHPPHGHTPQSPQKNNTTTPTERLGQPPNSDLSDCDEELFAQLRQKCEELVWTCMQGLINTLDLKDFKLIQSDLESDVCSFLSCDRYAELSGSPNQRQRSHGPMRPFFIVFGSLLISLCLAIAYYLTWVYSQSPDEQLRVVYDQQQGYYDHQPSQYESSSQSQGQAQPHRQRHQHSCHKAKDKDKDVHGNSSSSYSNLVNRTTRI